ncbi:MAG: MBL fold metallo-hydrolase [Phascolarctobacterium sp.]|nr:MBL fold metallo-hydrolase [Phascolarctobacterium sp.]
MKITFLGAARTVTGSCYFIETGTRKILVDCGMFQGSKLVSAFNEKDFVFSPADIDAVVLTHAHVDHSGLLPKLVKYGFKGPIHCTKSTQELCSILLPDSAHIQESDAEFSNRKGLRAGKNRVEPLFTVDDAFITMKYFKIHLFDTAFEVVPGITVTFRVAGHILGSAFAEMIVKEGEEHTRLVFTGDIGQPHQPIIEDPEKISGADFIITESTYGDRLHKAYDKEGELAQIVNETVERGGNLVIPAFAVGRTQVLLYYFQKLTKAGKIPEIPIIVDSPMANKATKITMTNQSEYDEDARALYEMQGQRLVDMRNLHFTATPEQSRAINGMTGSSIIISASGMADAGRILHHLKHNLWREESSVLFAGYLAEGCLGRRIVEGAKTVKIMGEDIKVNAHIYNMRGCSAHADYEQLLDWYGKMSVQPKAFFVTHGEIGASTHLAGELQKRLGTASYIPQFGDCVEIEGDTWKVIESTLVEASPAALELRDYIIDMEKKYGAYKTRIEQIVARDDTRASAIMKKLNKLKKYMDDILGDL